jgi:hypothetical protein
MTERGPDPFEGDFEDEDTLERALVKEDDEDELLDDPEDDGVSTEWEWDGTSWRRRD